MDILNAVFLKIKNIKNKSWLHVCLAFGLCMVIGLFFKYQTKYIDHPIEQIAENVLDEYGIDYDFSEAKKQWEE